jgi:3-deoxy-manno-octulosonate cytidylyltransferase (CMP-KDO synthetase)
MKTLIVIPVRMASVRFPNKPMALIDGIPMIRRVWEQAKNADIGSVIVACCEKEVFDLIEYIGGKAILTNPSLPSGTDRIFQAISDLPQVEQFDSIINLQGDMPIISSLDIKKVNEPLIQGFDIGTLVTNISANEEKENNITKAKISWIKKNQIGEALDFYKLSRQTLNNIYHHVGIYSFSFRSLKRFVELKPSFNELYYKLEQWRALDANMSIGVSYVKNVPLSVDTEDDLKKVESIIKARND